MKALFPHGFRGRRTVPPAKRAFLGLLGASLLASCASMYMTPLQNAAYRGDAAQVRTLLDRGASVNEWNYGTPLMTAAGEGRLEVAKLLIEKGADLDARAQVGYSALGSAARNGHGDMVDLLIAKGADIDQAVKGMLKWAEFVGPENDTPIQAGISMIYARAGMAYFNAGQHEKAITLYRAKAEANPNNEDNYLMLAASYNRLGKSDEAKAAAERAIQLAPDNAAGHLGLANALMQQESWPAAADALKTAIRLSPQTADAHLNLGYVLWNLGQHSDAIKSFQTAAELDPGNPAPRHALMQNGAFAGQLDEAIAAAGRLLDMQPAEKARILGFRSLLHREKGMAGEAAQDARDAYAAEPQNPDALFAMGVAALDRGDGDEAIRLFRSIDEPERGLRTATFEALAHARKGDLKEAEKAFAAAGEQAKTSKNFLLAPNIAILVGLLQPAVQAHLDQAQKLEEAGKFRDALQECAWAVRITDADGARKIRSRAATLLQAHPELLDLPEDARKHYVRGGLLAGEKKAKDALQEYEAAMDLAPCTPAAYASAARAAAELKQFDSAVRHMNAYLELHPGAPDAREARDLIYQWQFQLERQTQAP